ncbi:hypothetical protein [Pelosinus sp. sgz500959]|uniref:hypothetical protein n=1 Tax=Pelosinus sp. sgz500959 TaxID=3242472 RepID=UPI00366C496E
MFINTVSTLALYCSRCGKIHMHTISRFNLRNTGSRKLLCSCGQIQATITSSGDRQCLLDIPCVLCQTNHVICLDSKRLWRAEMDKIYCVQENFELGFVGARQVIAETINKYKVEFEKLASDMELDEYDDEIENPQVMLETLNKIHDMAEKGVLHCRCGSSAIGAEVLPGGIELECAQCGGQLLIPAQTEEDLTYVEGLEDLEIISPRRSRHKH